jgi:hypothetical protein
MSMKCWRVRELDMLVRSSRRRTEREKEQEVVVGWRMIPNGRELRGSHLGWVDGEW